MDADEVVEREVKREGVDVVLQLLAEPVRQAREPAHGHTHRQVLTFNIGR